MTEKTKASDSVTYTVRQMRFRTLVFDLHLTPLSERLLQLTVAVSEPHLLHGSRAVTIRNGAEKVAVSISTLDFSLDVSEI